MALTKFTVGDDWKLIERTGGKDDPTTVHMDESKEGYRRLAGLRQIYLPKTAFDGIRFDGPIEPGLKGFVAHALSVFNMTPNAVTGFGWTRRSYSLTAYVETEYGPTLLHRDYELDEGMAF